MTYDAKRQEFGREHIWIIELDLDFCTLTHGTSPCTATETGDAKCYNTLASCNDTANYNAGTKTYKFCSPRSPHPIGLGTAIPSIQDISITPSQLDIRGGLGARSNLTITFADHPSSDTAFTEDKYTADRTYIASDRGTFWGKLRARNPYYEGRAIRVKSGYLSADGSYSAADFQTRYYVIDRIDVSGGKATVKAKDPLNLASKAVAPAPTESTLNGAITAGATSITVQTGEGSLYSSGDYIRIGKEVILVDSVSTDTLTVTRGQYNTTAEAHADDDSIQICLEYSGVRTDDVIYDLLVNYAGVDSSFCPTSAWADEVDTYLAYNVNTLITEPTDVQKLLRELAESAPHFLFWDERDQDIKLRVLKEPPATANCLTDDANFIGGSVQVHDMPEDRISTVIVYYGQVDPTQKLDEVRNYDIAYARIDADSVSRYGSDKVKRIFSRWISSTGTSAAKTAAARIGRRFADVPRKAVFDLDPKDSDRWAGDIVCLNHHSIAGFSGATQDTLFQITSVRERDAFQYEALEFVWGAAVASDGSVLDPGEEIQIESDQYNLNLRTLFDAEIGGADASTDVRIIVGSGVKIGSTSSGSDALDTGTWPAGATVTLVNNGYIVGKGGDGGSGGGGNGEDGGDAINMQYDLTIKNFGIIGGGGGGGGGATSFTSGSFEVATAEGGGGAGYDVGTGYESGTTENGGAGVIDDFSFPLIANSGDGGDLGQAGDNGSASGGTTNIAGTGGAAGAAIKKNGNTLTQSPSGTIYGTVS